MRQWYRDLGVALWTRAANMVHKCLGTNLPDDPDYTPPGKYPTNPTMTTTPTMTRITTPTTTPTIPPEPWLGVARN
eukprot:11505679-Heterocapsa_arctica.AAC.1